MEGAGDEGEKEEESGRNGGMTGICGDDCR